MAAYTTINDSESFFQAVIYTGNGSADNSITLPGTTDMQPDMVWIKNREQADNHCLFDSVRGVTELQYVNSNASDITDADTLDAFQSDGFRVDADVKVNTNTEDYVAWCWKAGTTSGITTTNANTTPDTYSFSQTAGISIIQFDGNGTDDTQVAHGLGAVPHLYITKNMDADDDGGISWTVYHHKNTDAPETDKLHLDEIYATADSNTRWSDQAPDANNMTLGTSSQVNSSSRDYIGYVFSEKQGFSKFNRFTGNGDVDGPFCFCGFKPAFIIIKKSSATGPWIMFDNKRPFQTSDFEKPRLVANATGTDSSSFLGLDFLANGFKLRETDADVNGSGATYVYIAFAESPLVNSEGVPTTAV